ncbi:MAG: class I SAM-dependent methyltransferase [Stappiaceae bacterium]
MSELSANLLDKDLIYLYDLENPWGQSDEFYLSWALAKGGAVLDMSCGTGRLARAMAKKGLTVSAVVPDDGAFDVVQDEQADVDWQEADCRCLALGKKFDSVFLAEHTFQAFTTNVDQLLVLEAMSEHLSPGGQFALETRNPRSRIWERWQSGRSRIKIELPSGKDVVHTRRASVPDGNGVIDLTHNYRFDGGIEKMRRRRLRFLDQPTLALMLDVVGLKAERWYGDWRGSSYTPDSAEIIVVGSKS